MVLYIEEVGDGKGTGGAKIQTKRMIDGTAVQLKPRNARAKTQPAEYVKTSSDVDSRNDP